MVLNIYMYIKQKFDECVFFYTSTLYCIFNNAILFQIWQKSVTKRGRSVDKIKYCNNWKSVATHAQ